MKPLSLQIAFVIPGMPFNGDTLKTESLGGSETAGLYMAREMAKLGHKVFMFCNCEKTAEYDGVIYNPVDMFWQFGPVVPHDVTIVQRMPEIFANQLSSKLNVLWCHDMAALRQADIFKAATWNIDEVMVLSNYHKKQYMDVYDAPESLLYQTRNGIDLDVFKGCELNLDHRGRQQDPPERDPKKLMYCARPERGLDVLLKKIFPKLLEQDPELTLYVAGYNNQADHMAPFYDECTRLMKSFGDRCVQLGHLTKAELYKHYMTSRVYLYPTPSPVSPNFNEVSCITAMECQAAGLPVVTSARGALAETIRPEAGWLGYPDQDDYIEEFVDFTIRLVKEDDLFERMSKAGKQCATKLSWEALAKEWSDHFISSIVAKNESPRRLLEHFYKTSDIIAAEALMEKHPDLNDTSTALAIKEGWEFKNSPDTYKKQYENIGETHTDCFDSVGNETRLAVMADWLSNHPEVQNVVDWGCAMGAYAIHLSNVFPNLKIVGVDVDVNSINMAKDYQKTKSLHPDNLQFMTVEEMRALVASGEAERKADAAFACEVLEHVPDPQSFLAEVENLVKPGGRMVVTVPYGPWEHLSYKTYPFRCHMWEFDFHDLNDMFGEKPDYGLTALPYPHDQMLGLPLGWHFLNYTVDHKLIGQIDMERKLTFQRPMQTVSGVIMAGPNSEETLLWSLKSYAHRMDELIIADCGMSAAALTMADEFGALIVKADSPIESGFETPRNQALEHAIMDWVMWIDTDEKVLEIQNITRYLRDNMWNGYGIKQHHFAVDTHFSPDMPVRLFRRESSHGKCRWFGMIHEHPELDLNEGPGPIVVVRDIHIGHVGYLIESGRRQRFWRNKPLLDMDREKYPTRMLQKHFICRDNMLLAGYLLEQTKGQMVPQVEQLCDETIDLFREHFMGKPAMINVDTLQYYSTALKIMGIGVDVCFDITAGKGGQVAPLNGGVKRFANEDDLFIELKSRASEAIRPYMNENW